MTEPRGEVERVRLIEHMLSEVESDLYDKKRPNDFIESVRDQFDRNGTLSDNQVEALRKFYERI